MSGFLGSLFSDAATPEEQAQRAGLMQGLLGAGSAFANAGAPRAFGQPRVTGAQALAGAAQGFATGQSQGQQGFYQQQEQQTQRQRVRDFTAATGTADDATLTAEQRALRAVIPAQQRGLLGALGPTQGMQVLGGLLGRAPAAPQVVAPGGSLVDNTGRQLYQAPERPQQPQWVGTPETGYGWVTPPSRGGGGAPAPAAPPAGLLGSTAGPAAPPAPRPLDGDPVQLAALTEAGMPAGQPRYNPAVARNRVDEDGNQWNPARPNRPWDDGIRPPTGRINPNIGSAPGAPQAAPPGAAAPTPGFSPIIPARPQRDTETVVVPDPASPTGFRYAPRAQAGAGGMAAPAPAGGQAPVAVLRRGADGVDIPNATELVPSNQATGRTPADRRDDPGFDRTRNLRTEFIGLPPVQNYMQVAPQIEAIRRAANTNTGAADLDIVFAFAKMLDPTSVVREGEANSIVRTGGIFDQLNASVARVNGGGRLSQDVRRDLLRQAESRFAINADAYDQLAERYRGLASENGLNPEHVARPATGRNAASGAPTPPAVTAAAPPAAAPATPAEAAPRPQGPLTVATLRNLQPDAVRALAANSANLSPAERAVLTAELERRARNAQMGR